jgi:hypothetical protein
MPIAGDPVPYPLAVLPESLDPDTLRAVSLGGIGVAVLAGLLVLRLVQRAVVRVVLLGVLVGLGAYLWSQRAALSDCVPECSCHFAGFDVDVPGCDADVADLVPS